MANFYPDWMNVGDPWANMPPGAPPPFDPSMPGAPPTQALPPEPQQPLPPVPPWATDAQAGMLGNAPQQPAPPPVPVAPTGMLAPASGQPEQPPGPPKPATGGPPPVPSNPYEMHQAANDQRAAVGMESADKQSAILERGLADRQKAEDAYQARAAEHAIVQKEAVAQYTAANNAIGEMKTDPDRWWNTRSTGQKVSSFIGAALSGMLNPTGENSMVALMGREIDRDIAMQQSDQANKRAALGGKLTAFQMLRDAYGDDQAATAHYKASVIDRTIAEGDAEAAKSKSPMIQANWMDARAGLAEQRDADLAQARQAAEEWGFRKYEANAKINIDRGKLGLDRDKFKADQERQARLDAEGPKLTPSDEIAREKLTMEQRKLVAGGANGEVIANEDGTPLTYKTEPEAVQGRAKVKAGMSIRNELGRYIALQEKRGRGIKLGDNEAQELESIHGDLILKAKNPEKYALGVLAGPDMGIMEKTLGRGPTGVFEIKDLAKLRATHARWSRDVDEELHAIEYKGSYTANFDKKYGSKFTPDDITPDAEIKPTVTPRIDRGLITDPDAVRSANESMGLTPDGYPRLPGGR